MKISIVLIVVGYGLGSWEYFHSCRSWNMKNYSISNACRRGRLDLKVVSFLFCNIQQKWFIDSK